MSTANYEISCGKDFECGGIASHSEEEKLPSCDVNSTLNPWGDMTAALVGVLIGNFLIGTLFAPSLRKLRDIFDSFGRIEIAYGLRGGDPNRHQRDFVGDQERVVEQFNGSFRNYMIAYGSFKRLGLVFCSALILLGCSVVWQTHYGLERKLVMCVVLAALVLATASYLQSTIAPTPSQLVTVDSLANSFSNFHMGPLFDIAKVCVAYNPPVGRQDGSLRLSLAQLIPFTGYRLLLAVTDSKCSRLYFAVHGEVGVRTSFQHVWTSEFKGSSLQLGTLPLAKMPREATRQLRLFVWLFIPTARSWQKGDYEYPHFLDSEVTSDEHGMIGYRLCSDFCSWTNLDPNVHFSRDTFGPLARWTLIQINVEVENGPQRIVKMYKQEMSRIWPSRQLSVEVYPHGEVISD